MRYGIFCLAMLGMSAAAGCAVTPDDGASEQAQGYSSGPDGLAKWLGTSDTVRYLGQFLDWRASATTPFTAGALEPTLATGDAIRIAPANFTSPEVEAFLKVGREAQRIALPITVGQPTPVTLETLQCAAAPGIYVYSGKPTWLTSKAEGAGLTPEQQAIIDDASATATTEVLVALPGDNLQAPMVRFAFGIVERPLSDKPEAPVGKYWTIRAVSLGEGRCAPLTRPVFSISSKHDNLLTINQAERDDLIAGGTWYEQHGVGRGGFELSVGDGPGRAGIYRCYNAQANLHFISASATCEGTIPEGLLGFASAASSATAPTSIRRCFQSYGQFTHVLGAPCATGARDDGVLGWIP